jgi:dipicolinate synthase subunit B
MKIGYCFTGSFCTFERSFLALGALVGGGHEILPIMSENAYYTDTRFQRAEEFSARVEALCGRKIIHTVADAEPLGPKIPLDALVVAPCTGNTLAKVANGITDTAATMAIKAHLRVDRPLVIALATNDALSRNLANIASMLSHKAVYFVPMLQDSPRGKPHSLVAELEMIPMAIECAMRGEQLRPIFLTTPTH